MLFRRIVLSALLVGGLSGLLLTGIQRWQVIPVIETAERYEGARAPQVAELEREVAQAHVPAAHEQSVHPHEAGAWEPAEGAGRIAFTVLSNVLAASGFALVMLAAMAVAVKYGAASGRGVATRLDWRYGLRWGLAGYVVFFVAPTLGLSPEIPGTEAAPVGARQLWWALTVVSTAAGLAVVAFGRAPWRWAGLALLVLPHVLGAPHLGTSPFAGYPANVAGELTALAQRFLWATALANGVFWLALGALSGWTAERFVKQALA